MPFASLKQMCLSDDPKKNAVTLTLLLGTDTPQGFRAQAALLDLLDRSFKCLDRDGIHLLSATAPSAARSVIQQCEFTGTKKAAISSSLRLPLLVAEVLSSIAWPLTVRPEQLGQREA
jgi:hypothetical protein